jgi:uncharacterized protein (TIGR02118 family)
MPGVKLIVLYPPPTDAEAFERAYVDEHVPIAREKISGKTKFVFSRVLGGLGGAKPAFVRMAEIHFPSMEALQQSAADPGTQQAAAHATEISTGGPPVFLVAEETTEQF